MSERKRERGRGSKGERERERDGEKKTENEGEIILLHCMGCKVTHFHNLSIYCVPLKKNEPLVWRKKR